MAGGDGSVAMTPHVLIVAGSDSSGGAGIVRDVETVSAFGLRSSVAITAVTVQTHARVERIEQMPPDLVAAQMRAAFAAGAALPSEGPPPLAPPHKGEGNRWGAALTEIDADTAREINKDPRGTATLRSPPPPCGEGLGVGVPYTTTAIAAVKIGMLGMADTIEAVASVLASSLPVSVVLDPVLASTSGRRLLDEDAVDTLKRKLFPLCTLVTPNLPELALLSGLPLASGEGDIVSQAEKLFDTGAPAILVKGGHASGEMSTDLLLLPGREPIRFEASRIPAVMRGTGCMLASAIATHLAQNETLEISVGKAKRHVFAKLLASKP